MFGAVSWLVTVASGWVVNLTLAGRGLALAFFALGRAGVCFRNASRNG